MKKLKLKKETISLLNNENMRKIDGGDVPSHTVCEFSKCNCETGYAMCKRNATTKCGV